MTKAYNKGDLVTIIADWDRCGTVSTRDAVVYSCGQKQMVLTCAKTGEELGRNFAPRRAQFGETGVFPRLTNDEAQEYGLAAAEYLIADETNSILRTIARYAEDGDPKRYIPFWRRELAKIHEPRVAPIYELSRVVAAKMAKLAEVVS